MIIKILSSAKNFAGIHYSERKNDRGKSELLVAQNFDGLGHQSDHSKADLVHYMEAVCALNPRVKNKQFHAVISSKGKEHDVDTLVRIGIQYLEAMGYGKNPYLIYHHSDTQHRHIHLVSTRVDKQGHKVDDRFEKIRSQKVMQDILHLDPAHEMKTCLATALAYHFSTIAQFRMLLELKGFQVREKKYNGALEKVELIKYGKVQGTLETALIRDRIDAYQLPVQRVKQIRALLYKYARGIPHDQWPLLMKDRFGMDIILHSKKGTTEPYGYTVIDHHHKTVFKGSQLIRLQQLKAADSRNTVVNIVNKLAQNPRLSMAEFQRQLSAHGWHLHRNGVLYSSLGKYSIPPTLWDKLQYNEKMELANQFRINADSCRDVLRVLFQLKNDELHQILLPTDTFDAYKAALLYLDQALKWKAGLEHFQWKLIQHNGDVFLLDRDKGALLHLDHLLQAQLNYPGDLVFPLDISPLEQNNDLVHRGPKVDPVAFILDLVVEAQNENRELKNKKRKSIKH